MPIHLWDCQYSVDIDKIVSLFAAVYEPTNHDVPYNPQHHGERRKQYAQAAFDDLLLGCKTLELIIKWCKQNKVNLEEIHDFSEHMRHFEAFIVFLDLIMYLETEGQFHFHIKLENPRQYDCKFVSNSLKAYHHFKMNFTNQPYKTTLTPFFSDICCLSKLLHQYRMAKTVEEVKALNHYLAFSDDNSQRYPIDINQMLDNLSIIKNLIDRFVSQFKPIQNTNNFRYFGINFIPYKNQCIDLSSPEMPTESVQHSSTQQSPLTPHNRANMILNPSKTASQTLLASFQKQNNSSVYRKDGDNANHDNQNKSQTDDQDDSPASDHDEQRPSTP